MSFLESFGPAYAVSGLVVGFIVGMTGVGGGSLMTPLLVLLLGVHPATAVGTDLFYAGLTKSVGTAVHGRKGGVDWRIVSLLATGSVPASAGTLLALKALGFHDRATSEMISYLLGVALLVTAASLIFRDQLIGVTRGAKDIAAVPRAILTIITGAAIGALVSVSSVGAGAIGATALYFLYPRVPARTIVGSDIAHAVPLTLVAGAGHWLLGSVNLAILASLLVGSLPGIVAGSLCVPRVPEKILRNVLATVLIVVGGRLIFV